MSFLSKIFQQFGANAQEKQVLTPLPKAYNLGCCKNDLTKNVLECALDIPLELWRKKEGKKNTSVYARNPKGALISCSRDFDTSYDRGCEYSLYVDNQLVSSCEYHYSDYSGRDERHYDGDKGIEYVFETVFSEMSKVEEAEKRKQSAIKGTQEREAFGKQRLAEQKREEDLKRKIMDKL